MSKNIRYFDNSNYTKLSDLNIPGLMYYLLYKEKHNLKLIAYVGQDNIKKTDKGFETKMEKTVIIEKVSFDGASLKVEIPGTIFDKVEYINQMAITFISSGLKEQPILIKDFNKELFKEKTDFNIAYQIEFGVEYADPCNCLIRYKE